MKFHAETHVSANDAFAEIADFGNLETWDPFVRQSSLVDGSPMETGAVYSLVASAGIRLSYQIVEVDRPHRVVYQGGTKRVRSTDSIEVTATPSGSSITVRSELRFEGRMRPAAPLIRALIWFGARFLTEPAMRKRLHRLAHSAG